MALVDSNTTDLVILPDTYRETAINFLNGLVLQHPI